MLRGWTQRPACSHRRHTLQTEIHVHGKDSGLSVRAFCLYLVRPAVLWKHSVTHCFLSELHIYISERLVNVRHGKHCVQQYMCMCLCRCASMQYFHLKVSVLAGRERDGVSICVCARVCPQRSERQSEKVRRYTYSHWWRDQSETWQTLSSQPHSREMKASERQCNSPVGQAAVLWRKTITQDSSNLPRGRGQGGGRICSPNFCNNGVYTLCK